MAYDFYLDGVLLPVTPGKVSFSIKNQNKTITLINGAEINLLKSPGLTDIKFEALLPQVSYPFANGPAQSPDVYLAKLKALKVGKQPFRFLLSRVTPGGKLLYENNLLVSLEDYEITEDAEALGQDVKVTVNLKQWENYGTNPVEVTLGAEGEPTQAKVTKNRDASGAPAPKTYTVQKGDCLWNIAKKCLGDGSRYGEIAGLNGDKIQNPNLIYPGQVLTLP